MIENNLLASYIAPPTTEEEWRVVLSLAQAPSPAQAVKASNWRRELFSDESAAVAFVRLVASQRPVQVQLPPALDGMIAYTDEELRQVRQRMARAVLLSRYLPDYQGNLRESLYQFSQLKPATGEDLDAQLKRMIDQTLESMDSSLASLRAIFNPVPQELMTSMTQADLDAAYWSRMEEQKNAITTPFAELNGILNGGLREGRVLTVLGGPGGGKTTFCNQLAEEAANRGRPVVYVACEEPPATLYSKTLARLGKIDYAAAQFGWSAQRDTIDQARGKARARQSHQRLLYLEGFSDLATLQELVRTHLQRYADEAAGGGSGIVIIDYLQIVGQIMQRSAGSQARDDNQVIGLLMYELRLLAKVLNCMVIVISSQSRASGYGNSNPLTSGRGSNFIEYSSDVMISIDKDKDEENTTTSAMRANGFEWRRLALPKNRLGSPGECSLLWRGKYQEFAELTSLPPVDEYLDEEDYLEDQEERDE